ncbi:MAG: hypothetical protein KDB07_00745 [Planctomycetes bacterium]|nr:hypothetical protein [Planctomycetota bacterium]
MNVSSLFNTTMAAAYLRKQKAKGYHCVEANNDAIRRDARFLFESINREDGYFTDEAYFEDSYLRSLENAAVKTFIVYHYGEAVATLSLRKIETGSIAEDIFGVNMRDYLGDEHRTLEVFNLAVERAYRNETREAVYCLIAMAYIHAIKTGVKHFVTVGDQELLKAVQKRSKVSVLGRDVPSKGDDELEESLLGFTPRFRREMVTFSLSMSDIEPPQTVAKQMRVDGSSLYRIASSDSQRRRDVIGF